MTELIRFQKYNNMNKKQPAFITNQKFEKNLQDFINYKIPCELFVLWFSLKDDDEFKRWLNQTVKKIRALLETLYLDHAILPAPVLLILATTWHMRATRSPPPPERSSRERLRDLRTINSVLEVIETYNAPSLFFAELLSEEEMEQERIVKSYLKRLEEAIDKIRPRKQTDVEMRFCAQSFEDFFREITGKPMHEKIGFLLVNALGWRGKHSDLRLGAISRAKGSAIIARRLMLDSALDLQSGDTTFWGEKEKELAREREHARKLWKKIHSVSPGNTAGTISRRNQSE
jgi:hypothetical protein